MIGPDALRPELTLVPEKVVGDDIERVIPGDWRELSRTFGADAAQRLGQPVLMMDSLRVARHFCADYSRRIGLVRGAMDPTDARSIDHFDIECAARWAIVRADRGATNDIRRRVHGLVSCSSLASANSSTSRTMKGRRRG